MIISLGTNIKITVSDEICAPCACVTISGLPAGVDLEKDDFRRGPDSEEPEFEGGRLLCKDGSFVTDGRPFKILFKSGSVDNAILAAGVMAKHIIAPVRIRPSAENPDESICSCMPAGLQIGRTLSAFSGLCQITLSDDALEDGISNGNDLKVQTSVAKYSETVAALIIADSLFF